MRLFVKDLESRGIPTYSYAKPNNPAVINNRYIQKFVNRSGCLIQWTDNLLEINGEIFAPCVSCYTETVNTNVWGYGASIPNFDWRKVVGTLKREKYMGLLCVYITKQEKEKLEQFFSLKGEEQYFIDTVYSKNKNNIENYELQDLFSKGSIEKVEVLVKKVNEVSIYTIKYLAFLKNGKILPATNVIKSKINIDISAHQRNSSVFYGIDHYLKLAEKNIYINKGQYI